MRDWDINLCSIWANVINAANEYLKCYGTMYALVFCVILFDTVAGFTEIKLTDRQMGKTIIKKACIKKVILIICLAFATFLDIFLSFAAEVYGLELKSSMLSEIACVYIVIGQALSVCKRINRMTDGVLPRQFINILKKIGHNYDDKDKH